MRTHSIQLRIWKPRYYWCYVRTKGECLTYDGDPICPTKSPDYTEGKCLGIDDQAGPNPSESLPGVFPDRRKMWEQQLVK